jgi:hypothetical protein
MREHSRLYYINCQYYIYSLLYYIYNSVLCILYLQYSHLFPTPTYSASFLKESLYEAVPCSLNSLLFIRLRTGCRKRLCEWRQSGSPKFGLALWSSTFIKFNVPLYFPIYYEIHIECLYKHATILPVHEIVEGPFRQKILGIKAGTNKDELSHGTFWVLQEVNDWRLFWLCFHQLSIHYRKNSAHVTIVWRDMGCFVVLWRATSLYTIIIVTHCHFQSRLATTKSRR